MSRNKYRNFKTKYDGITFDSKKEMRRYQELKLEERAGTITKLEIQPEFPFTINGRPLKHKEKGARQLKYVADFMYIRDSKLIVEDVKSPATAKDGLFRLKKALFETLYDMELTIV